MKISKFREFIKEELVTNSVVGKKCKFGTKTVPAFKIYSGTIEEDHQDGNVVIIPDKGDGKTIFDKSGNPVTKVIRSKSDIEIVSNTVEKEEDPFVARNRRERSIGLRSVEDRFPRHNIEGIED